MSQSLSWVESIMFRCTQVNSRQGRVVLNSTHSNQGTSCNDLYRTWRWVSKTRMVTTSRQRGMGGSCGTFPRLVREGQSWIKNVLPTCQEIRATRDGFPWHFIEDQGTHEAPAQALNIYMNAYTDTYIASHPRSSRSSVWRVPEHLCNRRCPPM
jgi:hypothetical protein